MFRFVEELRTKDILFANEGEKTYEKRITDPSVGNENIYTKYNKHNENF